MWSRSEYLEHELDILSCEEWRVHRPWRDFGIEIEDWGHRHCSHCW
ncbi:DUF3360 family protein [Vibrio vulnificus]|nr:DUF3360 family protein [Vibrio vulnificus]